MDVGGEARDDQLLLGALEHPGDRGLDIAFVGGEPWGLRVGGVHQEQIDTLFAKPRETAQVGDPAVEGKLVHLEVAGMQHHAGLGADGDRQRVRDRVVHRQELELIVAYLNTVAFAHIEQLELADAVLAQLGRHEGQRQLGAVDRNVAAHLQQVRHRADVVFVTVGQHQGHDVVEAIAQILECRQDQVDARVFFLGKEHAAVDQGDLPVDLEGRHVAADVTQSTQRNDPQGSTGQFSGRLELCHGP